MKIRICGRLSRSFRETGERSGRNAPTNSNALEPACVTEARFRFSIKKGLPEELHGSVPFMMRRNGFECCNRTCLPDTLGEAGRRKQAVRTVRSASVEAGNQASYSRTWSERQTPG